jgi:hypothetical protein
MDSLDAPYQAGFFAPGVQDDSLGLNLDGKPLGFDRDQFLAGLENRRLAAFADKRLDAGAQTLQRLRGHNPILNNEALLRLTEAGLISWRQTTKARYSATLGGDSRYESEVGMSTPDATYQPLEN